ncbi:acyltransferase 3 [Fibrella aestuarina BUZ 2]|uniref:Acyltransferase 3 n=1 Tax=Fibrella aestuarina BUZ 2 TaxID=1166018 RepID=I0K3W3_9BACT|nr:acyltransferase [Fibrella aestuarina]CCG98816.1 acyltransferase 3 [Fibrella aestuarina BUZ 2]
MENNQTLKLDYIDTIRGTAILSVLCVHCSQYGESLNGLFEVIVRQGAKGVQLFFIASAFTLFLSMWRRKGKEEKILLYFSRRFFRIAPMYWIALVYFSIQNDYWNKDDIFGFFVTNLTFTHGFFPKYFNSIVPGGWSIAVEMTFYLMVPFLFSRIKSYRSAVIFTALACSIHIFTICIIKILVPSFEIYSDYDFYFNHYIISSIPVFSFGICFFYIIKENISFEGMTTLFIISLIASVILFILKVDYLYIIISFVFVLFSVLLARGYVSCMKNVLLMYIGKVSYSLYLVHFAVLFWLEKLDLVDYGFTKSNKIDFFVRLVLVLLFSVPVAALFYKFVEVPVQKIGNKMTKHYFDKRLDGKVIKSNV